MAGLVHAPMRSLDYVILHELLHLKIRHHNKDYIALLDKYMPFWQEVRKELNDFVLMPMEKLDECAARFRGCLKC
ncbi:MAG: M48 family metallopeptidase [Fibrobacteraceae bacterium]